ncbi:MAG TPA: acyl-homoserine-lactone synthase [Actinocrinis sp.]
MHVTTPYINHMQAAARTAAPGHASYEVVTGCAGDPDMIPVLLTKMFRLRYEVFHRQLGWDVDSTDGLERDEFDGLDPVYVLAVNRLDGTVAGCLRLLPTLGPHMLTDVPALQPALQGRPSPRSPRIWEISRLAVAPQNSVALQNPVFPARHPAAPSGTGGFGVVPRALLAAAGTFAQSRAIDTFAVLSSVAVECKMIASGIPTTRVGDRVTRIGTALWTTYCVPASALAALK